ncbi:RNA-binding S4 domain-containing protein [Chitinimonas arctica]|uniref:RNA-binding S4 domain-containing protein n=1 Tax=Chitinimonas arctica TaxID=2594795 RepID=A0A516SKD3_9NEIS|nr:RNA-binding S4 domain-containing protein [Chitinimonas arctica]QDQ28619.1 RNA-binding S4 domain-containing protein [Chitinimonas arctica]
MNPPADHATAPVRLDKWLWAARFFKTRSLATAAIDAGHVRLNDERPKPARTVKVGDRLHIRTAADAFELTVLAISERRGPAGEARLLYAETEASVAERARNQQARALEPVFDHPDVRGRPTKKWRRQLHFFQRKQQD